MEHPRDWPRSSYPGYMQCRQRLEWMAYDVEHSARQGKSGGSGAAAAYRGSDPICACSGFVDGVCCDGANLSGEFVDGALAVGMHAIAEEDYEQLQFGIHPD